MGVPTWWRFGYVLARSRTCRALSPANMSTSVWSVMAMTVNGPSDRGSHPESNVTSGLTSRVMNVGLYMTRTSRQGRVRHVDERRSSIMGSSN
ncbi:hypothetical protein PUNSTDRAFT_118757, partial [Punctularia strigosozonata HHB-11173 SS5]|uniref:uncharacterized protein n=1 Tax=Punctularia strigosozonata (strain HHB-11173) TaxID=741275 RepID=UPI0004417597